MAVDEAMTSRMLLPWQTLCLIPRSPTSEADRGSNDHVVALLFDIILTLADMIVVFVLTHRDKFSSFLVRVRAGHWILVPKTAACDRIR
jgi:hypothetical protein